MAVKKKTKKTTIKPKQKYFFSKYQVVAESESEAKRIVKEKTQHLS
jgi:hypothetical protein